MRHNRRKGHVGQEFGGSGEDSFVAVVVTKLTGALLFILLLTMVIMALIPKAVDSSGQPATAGSGDDAPRPPLAIATPAALPEAIAGRPYMLALAATGTAGPTSWSLSGELPEGLRFDPATGRIEGTPVKGTPTPSELTVRVDDGVSQATGLLRLTVYRPDGPLTLPSWLRPRFPVIPWKSWMEQGFGFLVLLLVHLVGMNSIAGLERWSFRANASEAGSVLLPSKRFAAYRAGLRLATLAATAGLVFWLWRGRP